MCTDNPATANDKKSPSDRQDRKDAKKEDKYTITPA